ncbi:cyanophycinase [Algoriphagus confluentis]|uniref:Cyanophycinase n=1 Tax=Algoriphagus confluentis TaxID=1697556 RepID=A0ABQ6PMA7_9BACT|nr:hypothetical protein Aconfl_17480 [Algoriphagus confluentis]
MFQSIRLTLLVLGIFLLSNSCSSQDPAPDSDPKQNLNPYSLGRVGSPDNAESSTEAGLVLMGGSTDVDAAMRWMIERSGGGDFLVIRASGGDGYNDYLYDLGGLNSVETLLLNSKESANNDLVFQTIKNAEALFIAGGDQSVYLEMWEGTLVEEAIQYLIHDKKIPIGGTSAGCAIMGEFVYSGENGSIISQEALRNPFDSRLTVRKSSLINHPFLKNTITDQHFFQRSREGRLVTFMARLKSEAGEIPLKAIGVDERTAVAIDKNGIAQVLGQSYAYFLLDNLPNLQPEKMERSAPLTWSLGGEALRYKAVNQAQNLNLDLNPWEFDWDGFWYVEEGILKRN